MTINVAIAYHSGYGHTARQAEAVTRGAASVAGTRATLHDVSVLDDALWEALDKADAIVFGTPTYMGGTSAAFQAFAEASSRVWAQQGWADKLAAGFTVSAGVNGDKQQTLSSLAVFAAQHGMHWVSLGLMPGWLYSTTGSAEDLNRLGSSMGAMAQAPSDAAPADAPPAADLRTAEHLGRRVATLAAKLHQSRLVGAA